MQKNQAIPLLPQSDSAASIARWGGEFGLSLEQSVAAELEVIRGESMGWIPLDHGVYLHEGLTSTSDDDFVVQVVGLPDIQMAAMNLLLLV